MWRIFVFFLFVLLTGCTKKPDNKALLTEGKLVFQDSFDENELSAHWSDTGGGYQIVNGELRVKGAKNKPLWLKKPMPRNARVEFTARSESSAVDIKAELFGDGKSFAVKNSYTATSYVVILGGWNNTRSIIARMNEHGDDREERDNPKGIPGKVYSFSVVRKDNDVFWFLDGELFLKMIDDNPLEGEGHEYFAFNNWASEVFFDDLKIYEI